MIKRVLAALALTTITMAGPSLGAAQAAPGGPNVKQCKASDRSDVQVDKKADAVTVFGDTTTAGNNYGCYTSIPVVTGDTVTFSYTGTCGGGTPRVYLQLDGGATPGENTFDTGTCTQSGDGGTVSYTIKQSGTVTAFALIYDRDNGSTTYSDLVIAGSRIDY